MEKKRILFALGEKELKVTSQRLLYAVKVMSRSHKVDLYTYRQDAVERLQTYFADDDVCCCYLEQNEIFWTMAQRDTFAKTFIKDYHDWLIPGTDLKYWKMVGFDDFLWNVSSVVFEEIRELYDIVVLPVPSMAEPPPNQCDGFYTHVLYYAKNRNLPVVGVQLFPVTDIPDSYLHYIDYWLVSDGESEDYLRHKLGTKDVFRVEKIDEAYSISTVEDPYKNYIYEQDYGLAEDIVSVMLINHVRNRTQILDVIKELGLMKNRVALFFGFVDYAVKDVHESDIFQSLIEPHIRKHLGKYFTVDAQSLIKVMMKCDVIISTQYIRPLSFMRDYGKTCLVYNPVQPLHFQQQGVQYAGNRKDLSRILHAAKPPTADIRKFLQGIE